MLFHSATVYEDGLVTRKEREILPVFLQSNSTFYLSLNAYSLKMKKLICAFVLQYLKAHRTSLLYVICAVFLKLHQEDIIFKKKHLTLSSTSAIVYLPFFSSDLLSEVHFIMSAEIETENQVKAELLQKLLLLPPLILCYVLLFSENGQQERYSIIDTFKTCVLDCSLKDLCNRVANFTQFLVQQ